jgi:hypothetical protein
LLPLIASLYPAKLDFLICRAGAGAEQLSISPTRATRVNASIWRIRTDSRFFVIRGSL